jgi:hypothetical protein
MRGFVDYSFDEILESPAELRLEKAAQYGLLDHSGRPRHGAECFFCFFVL